MALASARLRPRDPRVTSSARPHVVLDTFARRQFRRQFQLPLQGVTVGHNHQFRKLADHYETAPTSFYVLPETSLLECGWSCSSPIQKLGVTVGGLNTNRTACLSMMLA